MNSRNAVFVLLLVAGCYRPTRWSEIALPAPQRYHGILCKGSVRLAPTGQTQCTLAEELRLAEVLAADEKVIISPDGTWVSWRVAKDVTVKGHRCKGGFDWGVRFSRDGTQISCDLVTPEPVGRVLCVDGISTDRDGRIRVCTAGRDVQVDACRFARGTRVEFDAVGNPVCP